VISPCPDAGTPAPGRGQAGAGERRKDAVVIQILGLIVVGAIIGALARLIKPGRQKMSVLATVLLGIVGAIVGGLIGGLFNGGRTNPFELNFWGFVFAVIVAVLLVGVAEGLSNRNRTVR
jgi:uncharacterized membrane protein YeaQ/YmgE (transglycosylase-associated protein family)